MSRERLLIGCLACLASLFASAQGTERLEVADAETGVRVAVDERDDLPALRIHVAGQAESDPGIFVLFPEHVTARERLSHAAAWYLMVSVLGSSFFVLGSGSGCLVRVRGSGLSFGVQVCRSGSGYRSRILWNYEQRTGTPEPRT